MRIISDQKPGNGWKLQRSGIEFVPPDLSLISLLKSVPLALPVPCEISVCRHVRTGRASGTRRIKIPSVFQGSVRA